MRHIVAHLGSQNFILIFSILFTKKVEKLWQSVVISLVEGIDVLETRCSTELTARQSFPASFLFS